MHRLFVLFCEITKLRKNNFNGNETKSFRRILKYLLQMNLTEDKPNNEHINRTQE